MRTDSVGVPKDSDDIDSTKAEPPGCCANPVEVSQCAA